MSGSATPLTATPQAPLSFTISQSLFIHIHWISDVIQPSHLQLSPFPPTFNLSQHWGLFQWVGQSIGALALVSVLPISIQGWFPLRLTGLILQSKALSRVFSRTIIWRHQFFGPQPSLWFSSHIHTWLLGKNIALTMQTFWKLISLLFNMLSRFVIAFLSRNKHLLISWVQSLSAVVLEAKEKKSVTASKFPLSFCHEAMGLDPMTLVFWMFKLIFSQSSFTLKRLLTPLHFLPSEWYYLLIWDCWYFSPQSWFQTVIHPVWYFAWCTLYNLNKQCENLQPWCTPFPILNQSIVPCLVLTVASWLTYRFLRRQVRWYGFLISKNFLVLWSTQ